MPKVKKNKSVIHPNSRKALQLGRQVLRTAKLEKRHEHSDLKLQMRLAKMLWFKENIDATRDVYSASDVKELIDRYLNRLEREVLSEEDIINALKRHPTSSAFKVFRTKFLIRMEKDEFEIGRLQIPDLMRKDAFASFKAWNRAVTRLPAIQTVHVSRKHLEKLANRVQSNVQATSVNQVESNVQATLVNQVECDVQATSVNQVECDVQATSVNQVECDVQAT